MEGEPVDEVGVASRHRNCYAYPTHDQKQFSFSFFPRGIESESKPGELCSYATGTGQVRTRRDETGVFLPAVTAHR